MRASASVFSSVEWLKVFDMLKMLFVSLLDSILFLILISLTIISILSYKLKKSYKNNLKKLFISNSGDKIYNNIKKLVDRK